MLSWYYIKIKVLFIKIFRTVIVLIKSKGYLSKYPKFTERFEVDFANYIGAKFGVSFCNGTSAIEAALFACGVKSGDDVLVSSCTIHSTAGAIISVGAKPIFVDIDVNSLNFDPEEIDRKVTSNTKALVVVHLWGNPADMESINQKAKKYNLKVIEDCSHSHGATINGKKVGTFGDIGCFSLQGFKAVSAMEGGISVTNNEVLSHRLNLFGHFGRNMGKILKTNYAEFALTGIESKRRAHPLGILLATVDLQYLDRVNSIKEKYTIKLKNTLKKIDNIRFIEPYSGCIKGGYFPGIPVIISDKHTKKDAINRIKKTMKYSFFFSSPYEYNPPSPHYHQLKHYNDMQYRYNKMYDFIEKCPSDTITGQSLRNTEFIMERVLIFPNCYKFNIK